MCCIRLLGNPCRYANCSYHYPIPARMYSMYMYCSDLLGRSIDAFSTPTPLFAGMYRVSKRGCVQRELNPASVIIDDII